MRPTLTPIAFLLVLLLASVPAASATEVSLPRWSVGDEWTYSIRIERAGELVQTGDRHVVVTERGPFDFHGTPRDALTFTVHENLSGDPSYSYVEILDASTGALLATRSGAETLVAAEPCVRVDWPVVFPKSWTETCDLGFGPTETLHTVAGGETLTVPAGTFETLSVDSVGESSLRKWYAQEACGVVAELHLRNDVSSSIDLESFRCAPVAATPTPASPVPTGSSPSTPSGATPATRAPATPTQPAAPSRAATPDPPTYDYGCPAGTSGDACLASDADNDGVNLSEEQRIKTDPLSNDTDGDGVRDGGDDYPTDASKYRGSPVHPALAAAGLVGAALLVRAWRRKDS